MGVFDTHAHYDSGAFNKDRLEVLAGLPQQGVELIVNPGCDLPSSRKALELAYTFPFVYAAVGIHPSDCGDFEESQMGELEELARDEKVKAIGEIGLDYHWEDNPPKEHQKKVFALQMELAEKLGLPVAGKRDSQEICFIPDHDHARFIEAYTGMQVPEGNFVDLEGNVLGRHKGISHYTIGQRKGLNLSMGHPVFVVEIRPETNDVEIGRAHV